MKPNPDPPIVTRSLFGSDGSAGPVACETALRMCAVPEVAKACPLNLFQDRVIVVFCDRRVL